MDRRIKFIICALGIFISYFYYGIIQEIITKNKYGDEKFTYILSLVFVQCVVNYICAVAVSATVLNQGEDATKTIHYVYCAVTYLVAMVCSNLALKWVNYPTQVIGKSAKPIFVLILSVLLGRRSYPVRKYCFVLLVVIGVALFMFKDSKVESTSTSFGWGEILIAVSLVMDGLTAAVQERMRSESRTKFTHMMICMNKWSSLFLGIAVFVTGEYIPFIDFIKRHPAILWNLLSFSLASAVGQFFIYLSVTEFGPLPCSIITTTRKFFTILASVLIFGNVMLPRQWIAVVLVFSGLFLDAFFR